MAIARLIRAVAGAVAAVIVIAIILRVVSANPRNVVVSDIHDVGAWLVGPFTNVFSVQGPKLDMALNWGLAAVIYLLLGMLIARLLVHLTPGTRVSRARPVA